MSLGTAKPPYLQSNGWWKFCTFRWHRLGLVCLCWRDGFLTGRVKRMQLAEDSCQFALVWAAVFQPLWRGGAGCGWASLQQMGQKTLSVAPKGIAWSLLQAEKWLAVLRACGLQKKSPRLFSQSLYFVPRPMNLFLNNLLCQASISCSNKIWRRRWEAVGILRDDHFIGHMGGSSRPFWVHILPEKAGFITLPIAAFSD